MAPTAVDKMSSLCRVRFVKVDWIFNTDEMYRVEIHRNGPIISTKFKGCKNAIAIVTKVQIRNWKRNTQSGNQTHNL